jgi:ureidoacrylate peracid hydrolase
MNGTMLRSLEERLRPEHTALLVIDVQNDFCHFEGGLARRGGDVSRLAALLGPISALMAEARATGVLVVCLRIVGSAATDSDA